jgi:protein-L-isoaspartate(D-aspartate) O-methyltransferase
MSPRSQASAATLLAAALALAQAGDPYAERRRAMVAEIEADVGATARSIGTRRLDPRVMEAMATVPRHEFVPAQLVGDAYLNQPLPIGHGQTISQPYIVALMTHLLEPEPGDVMLEVGTGSGYQAAILSGLVERVYSIEIIPPLAASAAELLARLGFENVEVREGDGYHGWAEHAPFDGIVVTAAASHVPPPLVAQLAPGGHMVIPVGGRFATQQLTLVTKLPDGGIQTRQLLPVAFVPLTGEH